MHIYPKLTHILLSYNYYNARSKQRLLSRIEIKEIFLITNVRGGNSLLEVTLPMQLQIPVECQIKGP